MVSSNQIAKIMDGEEPAIVEEGYMQPYPSSPDTKKNIAIGGLLGILLAGGIIVLLYVLDDTIKDSNDVEKYLGLNTLGLIPVESNAAKQTKADNKKKRRQQKFKKNRIKKQKDKG